MPSYKLSRTLGLWAVIAFGLTNEIAAGLFFISTQIQQSSPGVGSLVPLLMAVGGAITLLTVFVYRYFFASGLIGAGGEYIIISRSLSPGAAFISTLLAWFGFTGALGTLAYAAPHFLASAAYAFGEASAGSLLSSNLGTLIAGLAFLWTFWLIHVRGIRLAGILAIISMVLVLSVSVVMIIYGFATSPSTFEIALAQHLHLNVQSIIEAAPVKKVSLRAAFGSALPVLFFGYLGLSTATQTGGEAINAEKSLPAAVLIAVIIVAVVYTLFAFATYHAVPWQVIAGLAKLKLTAYTTSSGLLQVVMPTWLASLINVLVTIIVVKTFLPIYLAQSRWIYAWSRDGIIPAFFAKTHARFKTPVLALTMSALLGSLSLVESIKLGYVFGVSVRVLSVMVVFFLMGLGMITFPKRTPNLYMANKSLIANQRSAQVILGVLLMLIATWFSFSVIMSSLNTPFFLQPVVQAAIVSFGAFLIYWHSLVRRRQPGTKHTLGPTKINQFNDVPTE